MSDRGVPQATEAERAVLGAVLTDPTQMVELSTALAPEDFFRGAHQTIYRVMLALYERREPPDLVMVCAELDRLERTADIGGETYLVGLMSDTPTAAYAAQYAKQVKSASTLRQLLTAARLAAEAVYAHATEPEKAIDAAQAAVFAVSKPGTGDYLPMEQIMSGYLDDLDALGRGERTVGIPTGLKDLDDLMGGFRAGELVVLAGRPGHGKSALAMQIGTHAAEQGHGVGVVSLEMSRRQLVDRMMAARAQVDGHRIRLGFVREDEWRPLAVANGQLSALPLGIDDTPGQTVLDVRSRARRYAAQLHRQGIALGLVIVDYLQLMHAPVKRGEGRVQEVGEISRGLKAMAKELHVAVLACAQLNRAAEARAGNRPQLADLRESGSIEQDADVVLLLYRESLYTTAAPPNGAELIVAKHRAGPVGTIPLRFEPSQTRFADAARDHHSAA